MATPALANLGFSNHLVEHLAHFDPDHVLGYRCQPPRHYLSSPLVRRNILALWECGTTVTYFERETRKFEQCSLEDVERPHFSLDTVQALLADLFVDLYEDDHPEQVLRAAANAVGFLHLEHLLSTAPQASGEHYRSWRNALLSHCGG